MTQIDLPAGKRSGLIEAIDVLADVKGVQFVHFNEKDVVATVSCNASSARMTDTAQAGWSRCRLGRQGTAGMLILAQDHE